MAGVFSTSCASVDLPVAASSVLRSTVPKKLIESRSEKITRSSAGAPTLVSPSSKRRSRSCDSRRPLGKTPRAWASASAASLPAFRLLAPTTRLRVP
ncbi:hypothetical protein LMG3412_06278 [Achromobacter deleyi]|nr:hypothetical protein LMG3412_06278 [Achromobacter deleyi]